LLDAQLRREPVGPNERGAADLHADGRLALQRQQLPVAPHGPWPGLDLLAADGLANGVVVVIDLERAVVVGAVVDRGARAGLAAQPTGHAANEGVRHENSPSRVITKDGETGGAYRPGVCSGARQDRGGAREEEVCGSHDLISPAGWRSRRLCRAGRR